MYEQYTNYNIEISDKYLTYLTFSNSLLQPKNDTILDTGYSFDTVFNNLTGDMVNLILLNSTDETTYRLYEFSPNSDVITGDDNFLKTLDYSPSNTTVFLNGRLLNYDEVNFVDSTMIKIIPTVKQGDLVQVFCGDTSYLNRYRFIGQSILTGQDSDGNTFTYNKKQILFFLNGNIIPLKYVRFGVDISFTDDITIKSSDVITVLTFNNEFSYFEYYPVSGQRDFRELDVYGNRPSYSPVSGSAVAVLSDGVWNLISGINTGYKITGLNGGMAVITDDVFSKSSVNIKIVEKFPKQANYNGITYYNVNDINAVIIYNTGGYAETDEIPVTDNNYEEIYTKFTLYDNTEYSAKIIDTDEKLLDVERDQFTNNLIISNNVIGTIDTSYQIVNNVTYLLQIINYNGTLTVQISNNMGASWVQVYSGTSAFTEESFTVVFGNDHDTRGHNINGQFDFNYTYIKNKVLETYWLGSDNVLSSQNWYLAAPDAKDIREYLNQRTLNTKLIPEILGIYQKEYLNDIQDTVDRLARFRDINTMDFNLMLSTLDMLGMYLNSSEWTVASRRKALNELNSFYRRVGTKESINFVGYVEDNIFRILSQLWTNDYINFYTEADFDNSETRRVFVPDEEDYGFVLSTANTVTDYGYVTDDATYIDYGYVKDPTSGEWVEFIDFTPPPGYYPTNRVILEYTVNTGDSDQIIEMGPDIVNKFYELTSAVLVLHDIVGDILFDVDTMYVCGTFYQDYNICLYAKPQEL